MAVSGRLDDTDLSVWGLTMTLWRMDSGRFEPSSEAAMSAPARATLPMVLAERCYSAGRATPLRPSE